jgi:predicted dehydrogenase
MTARYNVGIIGCGLIGARRAEVLTKFPNSKLAMLADTDLERANKLAERYGCAFTADWKQLIRNKEIDLIIISTTNDVLAEITIDALKHGKHVLVEKPAGRNPAEIKKIIRAYEKQNQGKIGPSQLRLKVGYNHRFHPSFEKAKELIAKENIGEIMFIRARYGHGGRLGYDKEWRSSKDKAGGGEMLDQGSHLVDLCRYFMGDFSSAIGYCSNFFWDMEVEDNCFALLKTKAGQVAQLHASCTQWKNIFSMEIFCKTGQLNIDGLGRSYGKETLTFYKMKPEMGIPDKQVFEWDNDDSWEKEYQNLIDSIESGSEPNGSIYDAYETIRLIDDIYKWSQKNQQPKIRQAKPEPLR